MNEEERFEGERAYMVLHHLRERDITDERVLAAMGRVKREMFIPEDQRKYAYSDGALPIGEKQTISQPYIVALMTQMLRMKGDEKVLEIGTGSGYQAAVLGELARAVYSIELVPVLAEKAKLVLGQLGYANVHVTCSDGTMGLPQEGPFDAVLVTAAAPYIPTPLLDQLVEGGRLVAPVGGSSGQVLQAWEREGGSYNCTGAIPVSFVPLRGRHGWGKKDWVR